MKSFIRWTITLGFVGSSVLTSWLGSTLNVLALTPEQIMQKLNQIPVFTIGNNKEILLSDNNDKKVFVTYMSHQDAQQVVEQISKQDPERKVEVVTLPLGKVYELLKEKEKSQSQDPPDMFTFIPLKDQLPLALSILKQENPKVEEFPGIPLFYGMVTVNNQETFLSVKDGEQSLTPFYFEKESLQQLIENIKKQQPDLASSITVKVTPLGGIVSALESDDQKQEDFIKSIVFVPSQESADMIMKLRQQNETQENSNE